jgi:hypothetical protein
MKTEEQLKEHKKYYLGCGEEIDMYTTFGFICGVPNGWGTERLYKSCENKFKLEWQEKDRNNLKLQKQLGRLK